MQFSTKSKKHRMFINDAGMAITDKQGMPRVIIGSINKSNPVIRTGKKSTFQQWAKNALAITSDQQRMSDIGPVDENSLGFESVKLTE